MSFARVASSMMRGLGPTKSAQGQRHAQHAPRVEPGLDPFPFDQEDLCQGPGAVAFTVCRDGGFPPGVVHGSEPAGGQGLVESGSRCGTIVDVFPADAQDTPDERPRPVPAHGWGPGPARSAGRNTGQALVDSGAPGRISPGAAGPWCRRAAGVGKWDRPFRGGRRSAPGRAGTVTTPGVLARRTFWCKACITCPSQPAAA
jgi:hypothetical protein